MISEGTYSKKDILPLLKSIGRIPLDFNGDFFIEFLDSDNKEIRFWAVKNIGKLKNDKYLEVISKIAKEDNDSMVRREATSTIGRMHSEKAISVLLEILQDPDPKVILQAIRALIYFKSNQSVRDELERLKNHPNEIIQDVIRIELSPKVKTSKNSPKHSDSPDYMRNVTVEGDVRDILKNVKDESIHLTFTSPPYYNARDYSIYKSYNQYLDFLTEVFKEVHRVTKEGRFFILNTSPVIIPRVGRKYSSKRYAIPFDMHSRLTEMGWEFIDDIIWLKPEGSSKNRIGGFIQHRKPLAYKPNLITEYLMVYRKKTDRLIDWNIKQYDDNIIEESKVLKDFSTSNIWEIYPESDKTHTAVFPEELCDNVIKLYSYKNDLVFDPFAGSGTFGKSAMKLNRYFFLTEINPYYIQRIKERLFEITLNTNKKPKIVNEDEFTNLVVEK